MRLSLIAASLALLPFAADAQTPPAPVAPSQAPAGAGGTGALASGLPNLAPVRPIAATPEEDAIARQRFAALMDAGRSGRGLESYDPMEAVAGAQRWRPLPKASAGQRTISDQALTAARDYARAMNSNALIIWRDGRIEEETYFGEGRDATDTIVSRSLAKPMTTAAVGRAIALGKIKSLDQPMADFFPEWRNDIRAKISVRMMLNMTSGFLPQDFSPDPAHILNRAYVHPRHDEVILHEYPIKHEPGTRYEYNNATSEMIAPLIERATGMRYSDFLSREVLKPLGAQGGEVWVNRPGGMAHSGCCLLIPPESWLRLAILFSQDGVWAGRRLLPEGYMAHVRTGSLQYPYYGLGVYVAGRYIERRGFANPERPAPKVLHSEPYLASDLFLFDGNGNQVVYVIPSQRLVILRTGDPPRRGGAEWDNAFLPNTIMNGMVRARMTSTPQPR